MFKDIQVKIDTAKKDEMFSVKFFMTEKGNVVDAYPTGFKILFSGRWWVEYFSQYDNKKYYSEI